VQSELLQKLLGNERYKCAQLESDSEALRKELVELKVRNDEAASNRKAHTVLSWKILRYVEALVAVVCLAVACVWSRQNPEMASSGLQFAATEAYTWLRNIGAAGTAAGMAWFTWQFLDSHRTHEEHGNDVKHGGLFRRGISRKGTVNVNDEWLNNFLEVLWPFLSQFASNKIRDVLEPILQRGLAGMIPGGIELTHITLGDVPLQFQSVKVRRKEWIKREGTIVGANIHLDTEWNGEMRFDLRALGMEIGVSDIKIEGSLVLSIPQLLDKPPFLGGISIFFANLPDMEQSWQGMGKVADWQVIRRKVKGIIEQQICNLMVLPNRIPVKIAKDLDMFHLKRPHPKVKLRVRVLEAQNLKAADASWTSFGKMVTSDPYVMVRIGAYSKTTSCVMKSLNPKWDPAKEPPMDFLIDNIILQDLKITVMDEDTLTEHDELGTAAISMQKLVDKASTKKDLDSTAGSDTTSKFSLWIDLKDEEPESEENSNTCKKLGSKVRIQVEFFKVVLREKLVQDIPRKVDSQPKVKDITCLWFIGIESVSGLPDVEAGGAFWLEIHHGQEKIKSKFFKVPPGAHPEKQATEKLLRKIKGLSKRGNIDNQTIADTLDLPVASVVAYLAAREGDNLTPRIAKKVGEAQLAGTKITAKWDASFYFFVTDPRKEEVWIDIKTNCNIGGVLEKGCNRSVLKKPLKIYAKPLIDEAFNTKEIHEAVLLDHDKFGSVVQVEGTMQLRALVEGHPSEESEKVESESDTETEGQAMGKSITLSPEMRRKKGLNQPDMFLDQKRSLTFT